ncbi:hypothetical protein BW730_01010 [Tessaracoccus aquimaris]|uniref:DUF6891 domain-containing protein n=1 Tax=Tessaracoccus aquimaris TaxID=1332264 RepID=A0A1Q2CJT9_9ACTN|nr:hypothetical protein [Tessaracoccus aquimaris]AQP46353.1 hypothetical protein BW730_01010 [Tessaracoccus aquimaris]
MTHPWNVPFDGYAAPADWNLDAEESREVERIVWGTVLRGETEIDSYLWRLEDYLVSEDHPDQGGLTEDQVEAFVSDVVARRREQQADLGGAPTSALSEAFEELAGIGILGREDFTCCGTCLSAEIFDERDESRTWRGYLAYHQQDTDSIASSGTTYLNYGTFLDAYIPFEEWEPMSDADKESMYERTTVELMREAIPVLERHGVEVVWDGDLATRILLRNVERFSSV